VRQKFCARATCGERATAVLLINARELSVQIVDIREDPGVVGVALCCAHAGGTVAPLGWTLADLRSPAEAFECEPELVLVEAAPSEPPEARRLPERGEAVPEDMEDAAVGEVPPLLSRAFRAAGLD